MGPRRILASTALAAVVAAASMSTASSAAFPDTIPLPDGWQPEGIATGAGTSIYAGSLATGAIWKADLRTGAGEVLVEGAGGPAVGMKVDRGLLYVAGGPSGQARFYDARTGDVVELLALGGGFVNDVTVTRDAAYFTDSFTPLLYRVSLDNRGVPSGDVDTIALSGDWEQVAGFNANGIASTANGDTLVVINSSVGRIYAVDPSTGEATAIDTGGVSLTSGDGILLQGRTLFVVRNQLNEVVELRLSPDLTSATLVETVTDPDFRVPTTLALQGSRLYAVNARFGTPPTPETTYEIVLVDGE
jgi:sugar lactone lactonase YvrE